MIDQTAFMETLHAVSEIIRTSAEPLSRQEIMGYFADMELSEEQKNMVFEYLLTPHEEEPDIAREELEKPDKEETVQTRPESRMLQMYREEVATIPQRSPEELKAMYARLLAGDNSDIKAISESWLPRVIELAGQKKLFKANIEDVIQEGNIAMFTKLNELCGVNEKTDVVSEILHAITAAMDGYISELAGEDDSEHAVLAKVNLVNEAKRYLTEHNAKEPTVAEIGAYTNLPEDELADILEIIRVSQEKKSK